MVVPTIRPPATTALFDPKAPLDKGLRRRWTGLARLTIHPFRRWGREPPTLDAQVAQLVEHVTENHGVGGSIPPLGTNLFEQFQDLKVEGPVPL